MSSVSKDGNNFVFSETSFRGNASVQWEPPACIKAIKRTLKQMDGILCHNHQPPGTYVLRSDFPTQDILRPLWGWSLSSKDNWVEISHGFKNMGQHYQALESYLKTMHITDTILARPAASKRQKETSSSNSAIAARQERERSTASSLVARNDPVCQLGPNDMAVSRRDAGKPSVETPSSARVLKVIGKDIDLENDTFDADDRLSTSQPVANSSKARGVLPQDIDNLPRTTTANISKVLTPTIVPVCATPNVDELMSRLKKLKDAREEHAIRMDATISNAKEARETKFTELYSRLEAINSRPETQSLGLEAARTFPTDVGDSILGLTDQYAEQEEQMLELAEKSVESSRQIAHLETKCQSQEEKIRELQAEIEADKRTRFEHSQDMGNMAKTMKMLLKQNEDLLQRQRKAEKSRREAVVRHRSRRDRLGRWTYI
ncbi:uncharacterized protein PAC_16564 [Phialocephala subalpina]|uniref:Uncharacterized protein n=1 Tax=Phialocephala subalpina TaxID=576137 RepID=A0A1L7XNQ7_9HELO|nr:uncharacterized protein PAC_16564 [Phialocephala subalpina]